MQIINQINDWLQLYPVWGEISKAFFILLLAFLAFFLFKYIVIAVLRKLASKTKTRLDDHLIESKAISRLTFLVPVLLVDALHFLLPYSGAFLSKVSQILILWIVVWSTAAFLMAINRYYETFPISKERPIKGYLQVINIILYIIAIIFIIGLVTSQSPWVLLSGIGAMTAVLLLIFKDTILSFVAGIQITSYDLLHVGDWIEMSEYGADGDVIDIALHTVKVQNWDKTITVIPTHKLTENSFKNWRGMQQTGGRRIKRSVYIDQNSIKFCDERMLEKFEKIKLLKDYIQSKRKELQEYNTRQDIDASVPVNIRRLTNLGTFRFYAQAYLKNHPKIRKDLTLMARHLPPGPNGIPIEVYAFTNDTVWQNYEAIQADVFDHLLSVVAEFELQIFQNPSGRDFKSAITKN